MARVLSKQTTGRRIVDDLLTLVRLERGRLEFNVRPTSLAELVNEALDRYYDAFRAKRIVVVRPANTHTLVDIDAGLFSRVVDHLLDNALRYTPEGGRVMALCTDNLRLTIANTGPRIPSEHQNAIFDKFFQRPIQGAKGRSGLGLYLCRKVVLAQGGQIEVHEMPGYPVCFTIQLAPSQGAVPQPLQG